LNQHLSFRPDDFDAINSTFFSEFRADGRPFLDPSGWLATHSAAARLIPEIPVRSSDLGRYYLDEGRALGARKDAIVSLIAAWEQHSVRDDGITLCHSISEGTLSILVALRRRGIRQILFETPGYAVTMNQADYLGLHPVMIPTIRTEQFRSDLAKFVPAVAPSAVWITQPRMSLGSNQNVSDVRRIIERLSPSDFLVIDEATEQEFPSVLRHSELSSHPRMIRIRGITKGMGLNGLRLAFILHDPMFRDDLESAQEVVGGSLDLFSLNAAAVLAEDVHRFITMLSAARHQTTSLRNRAAKLAAGSRVVLSPLVNGYMGSAWIAFPDPDRYDETRREFLTFCRDRRMAVIVAASMRFAFDPTFEAVRLNYFNHEEHILNGVKNLVDFANSLHDPN
jgi:histidinol-phosphate/aromatic aminotransferase/cobyric acid decarboxylase-like protein